ncbi:HK97 gp10 family phage protein [Variovorax sp. JS1663]|uniref:HK97 gp10 family phage protein n=1 Tax=Variovorax sp. JS1663 TaxID=1851577 RepID=UPI000B341917|nr:HK97 gp10 family phage protein [Variovorax sp. JS1663]
MANGRNLRRRGGRGTRPSGPSLYQKDTIGINVVSNVTESLAALEAGIKEKVLRSAARAGALVFYTEMRQRVPVKSGELFQSIYHYHDDKGSTPNRQTYFVGPNKSKAPHWHQVEFGHWQVNVVVKLPNGRLAATKERLATPKWIPAKPYVRPTWDAKKQAAVTAARLRMGERLKELMTELQP